MAGRDDFRSNDDFDFLAAYVIPEDVWYIFPVKLIAQTGRNAMILSPSSPGHKYEAFLEAWHLLLGQARDIGRPVQSTGLDVF